MSKEAAAGEKKQNSRTNSINLIKALPGAIKERITEGGYNQVLKGIIIVVCAAVLTSPAALKVRVSPFTAAFIASLKGANSALAFLGSVIGFAARNSFTDSIPALASMLILVFVRLGTAKNSNLRAVRIGTALLCGVSVLVTNIITSHGVSGIITSIVSGITAAAACHCLTVTYRAFENRRIKAFLKPGTAAAGAVVYIFGAASVTSLNLGFFNAGFILASIITLGAGHKFGINGAAVTGAASSIAFALAGNEYLSAGLMIMTGSIAGSFIAGKGQLPQAGLFILANSVMLWAAGVDEITLRTAAASLAGGIIFMLLPVDRIMGNIEKPPARNPAEPAEIIAGKITEAGNVMSRMKLAVEKTAQTLDKDSGSDISWVYNTASSEVCRKCRHNMRCWGEEYNRTAEQMNRLMKTLRSNVTLTEDMLSGLLAARCGRKSEFVRALNDKYREYVSNGLIRRKNDEMRRIVISQLDAAEKLLNGFAGEITGGGITYDRDSAIIAEKTLGEYGITQAKASAALKDGNMYIEAFGKGELRADNGLICDKLGEALHREFDLPEIINENGSFRMNIFERALYSAETAVTQIARGREKACGDYFDCFTDGRGNYYAVLSDGMGSGSRARIDSAFACGMLIQQLKAGVTLEAALEILNSSLLVKSSDESFATLDICKVDLYTGKTIFYKAGASDTFVKCGKKVYRIAGKGTPVGIDFEPSFETHSITAGDGDIIFMTSDGAEITPKWLEETLKSQTQFNVQELSDLIAQTAKYNCEKGREDDITVAAIKIEK